MRLKEQLVIGIALVLLLSNFSSAITIRSQKVKRKSTENVKFLNDEGEISTSTEKLSERQGFHEDDEESNIFLESTLDSKELVKKAQNVSEAKTSGKKKKVKEHSPPVVEVLEAEENSDEDGERLAKSDREADKSPRLYYDDAAPRFPTSHPRHSSGDESPFEHSAPEGKQKNGKLYFPKNYISSKLTSSPKRGHKPSLVGQSGKRIPDHVHFDENGHPGNYNHEYSSGLGHSHQHPVIGHHEEHSIDLGLADEAPYSHGIEEHHEKEHHGHGHGHHVSGYGYNHHHGSYRHTIGDKVDTLGKALQVLIPSALLITGVSALFPNRVHVPTTPNKYRQKRSVFRRRVSDRGMVPAPQLARLPAVHITPELEDIPSHILRAEHRIMDESSSELYPEYGQRYASSAESFGFNPFKVFKGPGPEATQLVRIQNSMPMLFPEIPNMPGMSEKSNEFMSNYQGPVSTNEMQPPPVPVNTRRPAPPLVEEVPPTLSKPQMIPQRIMSQAPQVTTNLDTIQQTPMRQRQNIQIRRRKPTTRKPPVFLRESSKIPVQSSAESQKSQYLIKSVKNTLEDSKQNNQELAEQEFMSSLQNLVTPDVAKAIVENKQETPKNVDLSPDGPVMGLLTSYAQHENDSPACQKRALCELAVKGKQPKSTKFEAFLWSVATLVPDVFSEMYDLQEVFQSIRQERCNSFACANPNLDLQA